MIQVGRSKLIHALIFRRLLRRVKADYKPAFNEGTDVRVGLARLDHPTA